jgi:hypothetical protein
MQSIGVVLDELVSPSVDIRSAAGEPAPNIYLIGTKCDCVDILCCSFAARRLRAHTEEQCSESSREAFGAYLKALYDKLHWMANEGESRQRSGCIKVPFPTLSRP